MLLTAVFNFLPLTAQTDSLTADTTHADETEAFSDTTSIDTTSVVVNASTPFDDDLDDGSFPSSSQVFRAIWRNDGEEVMGMFFVLAVLFILFVLSPIVVIGLILWFIYKNRQNRMRLAEMAMKNGQPIPDELVKTAPVSGDDMRQKGIREIFLGIGLVFLLGWAAGKIGVGIGILVLCMGLGNLFISRSAKKSEDQCFHINNNIANRHDTETL